MCVAYVDYTPKRQVLHATRFGSVRAVLFYMDTRGCGGQRPPVHPPDGQDRIPDLNPVYPVHPCLRSSLSMSEIAARSSSTARRSGVFSLCAIMGMWPIRPPHVRPDGTERGAGTSWKRVWRWYPHRMPLAEGFFLLCALCVLV